MTVSKYERRTPLLALLVVSGPAQGQRVLLDHAFLLGRDTGSKIALNDERVSRHHAMVEIQDGIALMKDLGSKNGTFLNGVELKQPRPLQPNDRVRIGKTLMAVVQMEDPEPLEIPGPMDTAEVMDSGNNFGRGRRESPVPATGQINRRALRRATDLAGKLLEATLAGQQLPALLGELRAAFQADNIAVFTIGSGSEPVGQDPPSDFHLPVRGQLGAYLTGVAFHATILPSPVAGMAEFGEARPPYYLIFHARLREQASCVFLLRRVVGKPFSEEEVNLADALSECLRIVPVSQHLRFGGSRFTRDQLALIVGSSELMTGVREQIRTMGASTAPVLITGETGTGKELCCRALVQFSERRNGPYVEAALSCMEARNVALELFGHEKGAFIGAAQRSLGKLEIADGGTVVLDEVGELSLEIQDRLLEVIDGKPFLRFGGDKPVVANVRFIAASSRDLPAMVEVGTFRRELYNKLAPTHIEMPPLRNRLEDIPELVQFFLRELEGELPAAREFSITPKALRRLLSHEWPGNVRELRNVLQKMMAIAEDNLLDIRHVPPEVGRQSDSTTMKLPRLQFLTEMIEREEISRALVESRGHKSNAARLLGISRPTLDKKIKMYGLGALTHARGREDGEDDQD